MKDNKQNLTDLIGALAVDIEEIKKNKVTVNYGTFKTTIDSGELERI